MAIAPKVPPDEATEILRRLEPAIAGLSTRLDKLEAGLHRLELDVARLEGRVAGIEGRLAQLPTLWTLAGLVVALFGCAFVLLRFAAPAAYP